LKDHQLIRKMITEMAVNVNAARYLCYRAGALKDAGDSRTVIETLMAKYFASKAAVAAAGDAVQIHGAKGCSPDCSVQRYYRDAKVPEIIEGSSQILEINIAKDVCDTYGAAT
jgi:alkylation response protein AidB-like acyl-CoA dehydrogenase